MPGASPVIIPVRQRTPEWLAARENGIGASQAAAAIDISPWQSRVGLWAEKLGLVPPQEPSLPMMVGTELEPLIARLYTEATGVKIRRATMLRQHPEHAFMLASLDRRAGRKPIELKYSARGDGYGDPGTDEVPDDVLAQVLHQLAVVDENEADVAALIARRDQVQIYTIRRDAAAEAAIIEREAEFWRHVEMRTEPPLDGSDATHSYLRTRYPRDDGEVLEADEAMTRALGDLHAIRQEQDAAGERRRELEASIQGVMGTASKIVAPGVGSITWKATKDRETVDWRSLAIGLRGALERVVEFGLPSLDQVLSDGFGTTDLDELQAIHTTTKPGPRMFGPPRWEEED
jgi:putative phage-type endonuclease